MFRNEKLLFQNQGSLHSNSKELPCLSLSLKMRGYAFSFIGEYKAWLILLSQFDYLMSRVVLIASDQGKFQVDQSVAKKSQLLKNMIEDTGVEEEIYLPNVKSAPLRKIIEFSEHYKNNDPPEIEKPLSKNSLKELVDPWDQQFINLPNQQELLELLLAANYLDIKSLIQLCCAKVATMIKGKSPEQIRQQFGIVNDFTPEQEAQIREENKWAEECTN